MRQVWLSEVSGQSMASSMYRKAMMYAELQFFQNKESKSKYAVVEWQPLWVATRCCGWHIYLLSCDYQRQLFHWWSGLADLIYKMRMSYIYQVNTLFLWKPCVSQCWPVSLNMLSDVCIISLLFTMRAGHPKNVHVCVGVRSPLCDIIQGLEMGGFECGLGVISAVYRWCQCFGFIGMWS